VIKSLTFKYKYIKQINKYTNKPKMKMMSLMTHPHVVSSP